MQRWKGGEVEKGGKVNRWQGGRVERWKSGKVERWKGGVVERWKGGKVERWRGGRVERWKGKIRTLPLRLLRGRVTNEAKTDPTP